MVIDWRWDTEEILLCVLWLFLHALASGLIAALGSTHPLKLRLLHHEEQEETSLQTLYNYRQMILMALTIISVITTSALTVEIRRWVPNYACVLIVSLLTILFGRILPSSFFHRHSSQAVRAFAPLLKIITFISLPIVWPLQKLLNCLMGNLKENEVLFNKDELRDLIDEQNRARIVNPDEALIMHGALHLSATTALQAMVPIGKVFMLSKDTILNFKVMSDIIGSGFSRIPVYEGSETNIVGLLTVKKIIVIDPADERRLGDLFLRPVMNILAETNLLDLLNQFQENQSSFALVNDDIYGNIVGIITTHDIFEELIQEDIDDENIFRVRKPEGVNKTLKRLKKVLSSRHSDSENGDDLKTPLLQ